MSLIWYFIGLGRTAPDPKATLSYNGVDVPLGKGINTNIDDTSLLYNEYPSHSGLVLQFLLNDFREI